MTISHHSIIEKGSTVIGRECLIMSDKFIPWDYKTETFSTWTVKVNAELYHLHLDLLKVIAILKDLQEKTNG